MQEKIIFEMMFAEERNWPRRARRKRLLKLVQTGLTG
jgi:hypothetical protein